MNRVAIVLLGLTGLCAGGLAEAQDRGNFTVAALAGLSGAFDSEGGKTFDHSASELVLSMRTDSRVWTSLRFGKLALDDEELAVGRLDSRVEFLTIAGESRFRQAAYDFGVLFGLGRYQLDAELLAGGRETEEALGITLGFTGDFDLTRRISVVAEITTHYVFFRETNFYGSALAGLAVHF